MSPDVPVVPTVTLAGFVSERLGEREAAALAVQTSSLEVSGASMMELAAARQLLDPAAVLASVETDRRILALHTGHAWTHIDTDGDEHDLVTCPSCVGEDDPCDTLRALASKWATHPDYRDAWAPTTPDEACHCGQPVVFGFDGDPTHHRGMCGHCDTVRCDAYPGECRRP